MTDHELLELAAKAAGVVVIRSRLDDPMWLDVVIDVQSSENQRYSGWNPLTDDGDALRLAVGLLFTVETCATYAQAIDASGNVSRVFAEEVDNPYTATRRAIVRAAAEIGRAQP